MFELLERRALLSASTFPYAGYLAAHARTTAGPQLVALDAGLTVSTAVSASGVSVNLSADGVDDPAAVYHWSAQLGGNPVALSYSNQDSTAAKSTVATLTATGSYTFTVTVDTAGGTLQQSAVVNVAKVLTSIKVSGLVGQYIANFQSQAHSATGFDQFHRGMTVKPTWSLGAGSVGVVGSTGIYTAPKTGSGNALLIATVGSVSGSNTITVGPPVDEQFRVTFATTDYNGPSNYSLDSGKLLGVQDNGLVYGWNVSHTTAAHIWHKNANKDLDSDIAIKTGGKWELPITNGFWQVKVSVGSAGVSSTNTIRLEGVSVFSGLHLNANKFSSKTVTIQVKDNRLTLDGGSSTNGSTHVDFIEATALKTLPAGAMKIDFAPATAPLASGYLRDSGSVFGSRGNNLSYGWSTSHTAYTADRNKNSNQLLDTSIAAKSNAKWEIAVPNGVYVVRVGVGDSAVSSVNTFTVENTYYSDHSHQAANTFNDGWITVPVKDGRLTINFAGADNLQTRLTHITIAN